MQSPLIAYTPPSSYVSHAAAFRSGATSPLALLETGLARLDAREHEVRAFVALALERARAEAQRSTQRWLDGKPLSPLDGIAIGVKDIIETADLPTAQGSPMWTGTQTRRDAASVQALRQAGAIIVGKTSTAEFAATEMFSSTANPHDPQRTPGGSSAGSAAAVGAGFVPLALGSQVVGSTIRPASYCGCIGFKPTYGALNRSGSFDHLSHSAAGLLGTTLDDVWAAARAIASRVGGDPGHAGLMGPDSLPDARAPRRLVLLETAGLSAATPGARAALDAAAAWLRERGVEVVTRAQAEVVEQFERELADGLLELTLSIIAWESRWPLEGYAQTNASAISHALLRRLANATAMTQHDYAAALARRARLRDTFAELMANCDGVVTLGATGAAPRGFTSTGNPGFAVPASILGVPALTLPALRDENLPLGLQFIGAAGEDAALFSLARWFVNEAAGR
ncbi:amidase [Paraburkholderia sp. Ac-20342]|uniref:amidase n=1 Tax=Paraburkholderia sp. Ac-20342 TaxID=2703889 RepID=UPI001981979D|nr:amidase [Paraburkholderia sp. Ac-20342]MBN3851214.1 amidase [Paraburkholderia sp. Ac-20342]